MSETRPVQHNVLTVPDGATYTYLLRWQVQPYGCLRWDLDEPITGPCYVLVPMSDPDPVGVDVGVYDRESHALVRRVGLRRAAA